MTVEQSATHRFRLGFKKAESTRMLCLLTYTGSITQITVRTCNDEVYIFDVRKQPSIILDGAVIRLLQSRELVKVRILGLR